MRGKTYLIGLLVVVLACFATFTLCTPEAGAADKVFKWKMQTHWPASSSSFSASAEVVVKKLKERTNGRLEIELFPAGALVPAKELFNAW